MRNLPLARTVLVATAVLAGRAFAGGPGDAKFESLAHEAIEHYLVSSPEDATSLGDHRFDDRLSDFSAAAREAELQTVASDLAALAKIDMDSLTGPNRVDSQILKVQLQLLQFKLTDEREYAWNPLTYTPSLANSVYLLVARDFGPAEARLRAAKKRLEGIPAVVEQAKANLKNPPRIHTETAIKQTAGAIDLVEHGLDSLLEQAPQLKAELAPAQRRAAAALAEYKLWLEKEVLPHADGDFRLGADRFRKKLRLTLDSDLSPEEILAGAERELGRATDQLYDTAAPLYRQYFPHASAADLADRNRVIRAVFDHLARNHADDATVVARAKEITEEATAFVRSHDLVTLPTAPLAVIELPEFLRGVAIAYCDSPGALEPNGRTFFEVSPTPAEWSAERKVSFFRIQRLHVARPDRPRGDAGTLRPDRAFQSFPCPDPGPRRLVERVVPRRVGRVHRARDGRSGLRRARGSDATAEDADSRHHQFDPRSKGPHGWHD